MCGGQKKSKVLLRVRGKKERDFKIPRGRKKERDFNWLAPGLLAIDHAHTLLGTACISSASAALKLRSPGAAPL